MIILGGNCAKKILIPGEIVLKNVNSCKNCAKKMLILAEIVLKK
jgi:hypothetical protein